MAQRVTSDAAPTHSHPLPPQVSKISNVKALVKVGRASGGLPLRVTEVATLSYGGVLGISDTAGGCLVMTNMHDQGVERGAVAYPLV